MIIFVFLFLAVCFRFHSGYLRLPKIDLALSVAEPLGAVSESAADFTICRRVDLQPDSVWVLAVFDMTISALCRSLEKSCCWWGCSSLRWNYQQSADWLESLRHLEVRLKPILGRRCQIFSLTSSICWHWSYVICRSSRCCHSQPESFGSEFVSMNWSHSLAFADFDWSSSCLPWDPHRRYSLHLDLHRLVPEVDGFQSDSKSVGVSNSCCSSYSSVHQFGFIQWLTISMMNRREYPANRCRLGLLYQGFLSVLGPDCLSILFRPGWYPSASLTLVIPEPLVVELKHLPTATADCLPKDWWNRRSLLKQLLPRIRRPHSRHVDFPPG